jgi:hypothetical protein
MTSHGARLRGAIPVFGSLVASLAVILVCSGTAVAAPVALDVPNNGAAPQVVFDPVSQNTFIAWTDPQTTSNGAVDLCVLLKNTSSCEGGGPVALTVTTAENPAIHGANTISLGGMTVLPNGDVVVIGTPVSTASVTWESPGDGSAFLTSGQGLQNGGGFISPVSLFYTTGNVVALSNTDVGLLDDYGNYFSDSPFAGPESPAINASNTNPPPQGQNSTLYPRKALGTTGPEVAAEAAPAPAAPGTDIVVGVGDNYAGPNTQLSDCVNGDATGTGYGVDVGTVAGNSNAAGTLNHIDPTTHASIPAYSGLACNAENPVVASPEGGSQGIGVLENEGDGLDNAGTTYTLDYRPFVASATGGSFGAASQVANLTGAAGDIDVVDDTTDGVYALFAGNGGLYVNYSADGGAVWGPPVAIPEPTTGEIGDPIITAIGGGEFLLAYDSNLGPGAQTFAQAFSYQALEQAPTAISTIQHSGPAQGADLSIAAGTIGESDTARITGANASSATGTVDFALYNNSSCTGAPVFSGTGEASAGTASIADDASPGLAPGKYYWKAAYTGNTTNGASVSNCGSEVLTVSTATTLPATGTTNGSTVTLTVSCAAACTVTITIELPASGGAASVSLKKRKPVVIADGKFSLKKRGKKKLELKLTRAGKKLVRKDHGKLKTTLLASDKTQHGTFKSSKTLRIKIIKKK